MTTDNDNIRYEKLNKLLEKLKRGETVHNRELRTWLGKEGFAEYEAECAAQVEFRAQLKDKPAAVKEYERRLRLAFLAYNKAEEASTRERHAVAKKHFYKAEALFERALEHLQEVVAADSSLSVWFDRDTTWSADGDVGLDPISIPRVVTSRSLDNMGGGLKSQLQTKREVKVAAIERTLWTLDEDAQQVTDVELAAKRKRFEEFLKLP